MHATLVLLFGLHYAATLILFGMAGSRLVLPLGNSTTAVDARLRQILPALAILASLTAIALVGAMTANMAGGWSRAIDGDALGQVLGGTEFGHVWTWHIALAALLLVATFSPRRPLRIALLAALATAGLALIGHAAMAEGWSGDLRRVNQAIHLLAAGAWVGGVATLSLSLYATRARPEESIPVLRRFSRAGSIIVVLLLVTGIINSVLLVGSPQNFIATEYGRCLIAKLVLVLAMVGFASFNRAYLLPRFQTNPQTAPPRLRRLAILELVAGILIILIACLLGSLDPPGV